MKNHRVIVWRVTQNCNMNCLFCSYSNEVERKRDITKEEEVMKLINILGAYKKINSEKILVSWIGGEPLLWKPILEFSKKIKSEFGINISTTTNGLMLDLKEVQDCLLDFYDEIVISLDGFADCNDRVRQHRGHFKTVTKNISELSKLKKERNSKLIIKVNTILMEENIVYFEEFCEELFRIGVNEVTFNQLGGFDRPEFYPTNRLKTEQVELFFEKFPSIKDKFQKMGLIIHGGNSYEERIKATTNNQIIKIDECNPGNWFWFINENGFISPCSYTTYEYKYDIKWIKEISDIEKVEEFFKEQRAEKRSKWCSDCHCTQVYNKFI